MNLLTERPCEECGQMVDLSTTIALRIVDLNAGETVQQMTEANARQLLAEAGIPPPPVICSRHAHIPPIETSRD